MLPSSLAASATTWLLVITWPCLSSTNPEPVAPRGSPLNSAMIWTVLGSTWSATAAMLLLSAGSGAAVRFSTRSTPPLPSPPLSVTSSAPRTPPPMPSSSESAATIGHTQPERRARGGLCEVGSGIVCCG